MAFILRKLLLEERQHIHQLLQSFCTVGFARSDDKVQYLKNIEFDEAINYKTMTSLKETLEKTCPKGIDMFFDNVRIQFSFYSMIFILTTQ